MHVAANSGASNSTYRTGTCPAAAFAGGAATLLRDYYDYRGWSSDPGAVYAAMITFGDEGGSDLDDNDGAGDQHRLPGMGTVDWPRLVRVIAGSSYKKPLSMEVSQKNSGYENREEAFLEEAHDCGMRISEFGPEGKSSSSSAV